MGKVDQLKSFESACYCDLVHITCTYCDAVAMDKMTTKRPYAQPVAMDKNLTDAKSDKCSGLACSVQFLLDRLSDFEPDNINDENARDWNGHVVPAIERLKQSLEAIE